MCRCCCYCLRIYRIGKIGPSTEAIPSVQSVMTHDLWGLSLLLSSSANRSFGFPLRAVGDRRRQTVARIHLHIKYFICERTYCTACEMTFFNTFRIFCLKLLRAVPGNWAWNNLWHSERMKMTWGTWNGTHTDRNCLNPTHNTPVQSLPNATLWSEQMNFNWTAILCFLCTLKLQRLVSPVACFVPLCR